MSGVVVTTSRGSAPVITTSAATPTFVTTPTRPINVTAIEGEKGPQGEQGPPGADALWARMTFAEFEAMPVKDPNTLYVIIG